MAKINGVCVGESLVGEGNEVAHIDLIMGPRGSAVESAFAHALTNNKDGFTSLLAVVAPNLLCKPPTILFNKVTIKGAKQAVQMFGPAQHAVAKAVADSVAEGIIPARRSRQPLHLRRRVHPLGSRRRQEDPGLQLSRHQGSDRARRQRRTEGVRGRRQARPGQAPVRRLGPRADPAVSVRSSFPAQVGHARLAQGACGRSWNATTTYAARHPFTTWQCRRRASDRREDMMQRALRLCRHASG